MLDINQKDDQQVIDLLKALGRAYLENGENQKASEKYRQLINQGIEDPEILRNFALALARMQSIDDKALHIYKKAVATEQNDEALYLTLSTLLLKEKKTDELALKVYQRSLKFNPPFEEELRTALEKIFQDTTETISIPELRQSLLDSHKNPELLYLFLFTSWQEEKYDEALHILKDLYLRSHQNSIYLNAICQTLFEKKSNAEEKGLEIRLSSVDIQYCLKFRNLEEPFRRIKEIEFYLDFKNLCSALPKDSKKLTGSNNEYEFFLSDEALENIEEITESKISWLERESSFKIIQNFIDKFGQINENNQSKCFKKSNLINLLNSIAIFEILNFNDNPENSQLPFSTFLDLISRNLAGFDGMILCRTEDGLITFGTNPNEIITAAVDTLKQLERYNQVVEEFENIDIRITLHLTPEPLIKFENQGLKELRKAIKIHNIGLSDRLSFTMDSGKDFSESKLLLMSEPVVDYVQGFSLKKVGDFRLPHLPNKHPIYEVLWKDTIEKIKIGLTKKFGRFEVSETIKENQLYSTFRGTDPQLDRPVIIKAYKAQAFAGFKDFTQLRKQFYEEVRKLNRIVHPNVAVIYDAGEEGDILYLVREYINGIDLNHHLSQQGLPDVYKTLKFYLQVIKILVYYHQSQIWHKNLKPNNIILTQQNDIKLADGGLLQVRHTDKVWHDDLESQSYASPEQIQSSKLTQSCDVFLLGIMLYESLTGTHPYWAQNASEVRIKTLADDPAPPSNLRFDLPKALDGILAKALAKSPEDRYQSINEFASALRGVYGEQEIPKEKRLFEMLK
ncbi:MAG: protein kinase [bacterium]